MKNQEPKCLLTCLLISCCYIQYFFFFFDYVRKLKKGRKVDLQEFWGENLCCETAGIGKQKKNGIKERKKERVFNLRQDYTLVIVSSCIFV